MNDENIREIHEEIEKLKAELKDASTERRDTVKRSMEVSIGFCDKLAALDAGSIAIATSIGLAVISKPELRSTIPHVATEWFVIIVIFLWLSLVCAVVHSFIMATVAKLEADYSLADWSLVLLRFDTDLVPADQLGIAQFPSRDEIEQQEKLVTQRRENIWKRRFLFEIWARGLALLALVMFLTAYTLVMIQVVHLW